MHFHIGQCGGEDIHPLRMADIEQRALKRVEGKKHVRIQLPAPRNWLTSYVHSDA